MPTRRTKNLLPPRAVPLTLGLAAVSAQCRQAPPPPAVTAAPRAPDQRSPPAVDASSARCDLGAVLTRLRAAAVDREHYAQRTLYTWTTRDQADALRRGGALLTREVSPTHGVSTFDGVIANMAARRDPVAALLRQARFRKARFAWKTPWATVRGWEGETYGDRLLRVVLRPEAWVLRVTSRARTFTASDLFGRLVSIEQVRGDPGRIGAVYFLQDAGPSAGIAPDDCSGELGRFREFVLPNEGMIESWELDTPAVQAALDDAVELVTLTREAVASGCAGDDFARRFEALPRADWDAPGAASDAVFGWHRALALDGPRYVPTVANLDALIHALRAVPRGSPYVGRPETASPTAASHLTPVRPPSPPRPRGTYLGTYYKP